MDVVQNREFVARRAVDFFQADDLKERRFDSGRQGFQVGGRNG